MKKVFFSLALVVSGSTAFAQINKGQFLVGGNVSFTSTKQVDAEDDDRATEFTFSPNAGYFFANQLAGGLRVNLETYKEKGWDEGTSTYTVAPFVRYYILPAAQKINVFADASYGFGSVKAGEESEGINQFSIMAGPAVFLTPNTALEFTVGYKSVGGEYYKIGDDVKRVNSFGVNVGFQIHLGGKK